MFTNGFKVIIVGTAQALVYVIASLFAVFHPDAKRRADALLVLDFNKLTRYKSKKAK